MPHLRHVTLQLCCIRCAVFIAGSPGIAWCASAANGVRRNRFGSPTAARKLFPAFVPFQIQKKRLVQQGD
jgi:hypothetical protein